jgi:hypothetical protein
MVKSTIFAAFMLGIALEFSALLVIFCMPETLHLRSTTSDITEPVLCTDLQPEERAESTWKKLQKGSQFITKLAGLVSTQRVAPFAISAFLTNRFGRQLMSWMLQYVSKRLKWSFANVGIPKCF